MSQINPVRASNPKPTWRIGETVKCELFPEMELKITNISGDCALLRTPRGNERWVALRRLSKP